MRRELVAVLLFLASCNSPGASTSTSAPPETTAPPSASIEPTSAATASAPGRVVLHAYNVHLDPSAEQGADRFDAVVHATGSISIEVTGAAVDLCAVSSVGATPGPCTHGSTLELQAKGLAVKATGASVDIEEISIDYVPVDRSVQLGLPLLAPKPGASACKDNGCNPFFEMTPFSAGSFSATANWDGIATGKLSLIAGGVVSHEYSASGQPYEVIGEDQGSSDQGRPNLHVAGTVTGAESALVLENEGARPLLSPTIDATWPG